VKEVERIGEIESILKEQKKLQFEEAALDKGKEGQDEFEDYYAKRRRVKDQPPPKPGVVATLNKIEIRHLEDERDVKKEWHRL
jgi:hypothetical protein